MKRWIYSYWIPLGILIALIVLPFPVAEEAPVSLPPAPAQYQGQQAAPAGPRTYTPFSPAALNPRGRLTHINFRDPITGVYKPVADGAQLPADVYHFNAAIRNEGDESFLAYVDVAQQGGPPIVPLGPADSFVAPGQELYLFLQGTNLKPAGGTFRLVFVLRERGADRVLDQRTLTVGSTDKWPLPPPALNPRGSITQINYRDPATGVYKPVVDGSQLPADVYHFNAGMRNDGDENFLACIEMVQHGGPNIEPLGAEQSYVRPGDEAFLFKQCTNLKPAGATFQLTFVLKERVSDRVLDQRTLRVSSR